MVAYLHRRGGVRVFVVVGVAAWCVGFWGQLVKAEFGTADSTRLQDLEQRLKQITTYEGNPFVGGNAIGVTPNALAGRVGFSEVVQALIRITGGLTGVDMSQSSGNPGYFPLALIRDDIEFLARTRPDGDPYKDSDYNMRDALNAIRSSLTTQGTAGAVLSSAVIQAKTERNTAAALSGLFETVVDTGPGGAVIVADPLLKRVENLLGSGSGSPGNTSRVSYLGQILALLQDKLGNGESDVAANVDIIANEHLPLMTSFANNTSAQSTQIAVNTVEMKTALDVIKNYTINSNLGGSAVDEDALPEVDTPLLPAGVTVVAHEIENTVTSFQPPSAPAVPTFSVFTPSSMSGVKPSYDIPINFNGLGIAYNESLHLNLDFYEGTVRTMVGVILISLTTWYSTLMVWRSFEVH
jgi:hypothetical protein